MRWDLVIFDCDGVLIDSELLSIRADRECLAECGIELSAEEILERYTGISFAGMVADIEARHGPLPADFADRHRGHLWPLFERELQPIPGVAAVLNSLICRICVASSGRPERLKHALVAGGPLRPLSSAHLQRGRGRARQARARSVSPRGGADGSRAASAASSSRTACRA